MALHIVADSGTRRVVLVLESGLDSLGSFHPFLLVDSWVQMNRIARTRCNSVLIQALDKTQDSLVLRLLVALMTAAKNLWEKKDRL
jgi:hypothetical protein